MPPFSVPERSPWVYVAASDAAQQIAQKKTDLFHQKQAAVYRIIEQSITNMVLQFRFRDDDLALKDWLENLGYVVQIQKPRFWDSCKAWHFLVTNPNKIPNPRNSK